MNTQLVRDGINGVTPRSGRSIRFEGDEAGRYVEAEIRAVAQLAGGIAHDLNNLLAVIRGNADMALLDLDARAGVRLELEEIRQASTRAESLTKLLLDFSHRQVLQPRMVDLNEVISADLPILRRLMALRAIGIEQDLDPHLGTVKADIGQLHQILLNLALNARDAMPNGGRLRIRTRNVERACSDVGSGRTWIRKLVCLSITDSGVGIPAEAKRRIFEPFFSTKAPGRGTGLGLSIVCGIVQQLGGQVEVDSEPGAGTTFYVYFPSAEEGDSEPAPAPQGRQAASRILLVEDDDALRRLLRRMLEREGYAVVDARTGEDAIALCGESNLTLDLLITDVILPGMNGAELAERLRVSIPRLSILFMSGYPDEAMQGYEIGPIATRLLRKPTGGAEFISRVRALLSDR